VEFVQGGRLPARDGCRAEASRRAPVRWSADCKRTDFRYDIGRLKNKQTCRGNPIMALSLYDASVANYLQTLGAVSGFLDRGLAHFREHNIDPETIVEARLAPDMLPLRFQIISVAQHSRGAIEGVQQGVFNPPSFKTPFDFAGLQGLVAQAREVLSALTPEAVNALGGNDVIFALGDRKLPFTAEGFLMSFSLPNFYFHATTAYDILRTNGVPLGKRDFMGRLKMKT
jgi:hypothetical protein